MIHIAIDVPLAYRRRAEYVFEVFSQQWGLPVRVVDVRDPDPVDVRYAASPGPDGDSAIHIPFDQRIYDPAQPCTAVDHHGTCLWNRVGGAADPADVVGGAYRLLMHLDEQQIDPGARDRRGVFRTGSLPPARRDVAHLPLVDDHASILLDRIVRQRPGAVDGALPKWPDGKRYAVAVTHDTDAVSLGAPRELLTNLAKFVLRRDRVYADMVRTGVAYLRDATGNPLFGFPVWRDLEEKLQFRSTFYLYARTTRLKPDFNNCKSSVVDQDIDWGILRSMADAGWEFGLHAPINSKDRVDALAGAKQWIEDRLGVAVHGLRHHYWALDWAAPYATWRRHMASGFRYDTSIAWRDVAGFRAATCHPYRPFDPVRDEPLDFQVLPTCLMDGHVVSQYGDLDGDVEAGLRTIQQVRARGGLAVLDWHTETACDDFEHRGVRTTLMRTIEPLLASGDAWFATAWEIAQHWHDRSRALEADRLTR